MSRAKTLRGQLIAWLVGPLVVLWSISTVIDYDIAKRFVNLAYDRTLLETALDIGRQVRVINDRIYVDLPDVALQMLKTRESERLYYLVSGPGSEFITGEPDLPPPPDASTDRVRYYDDAYRGRLIRVVALRVPVQPGTGKGAVLIQVGERMTLRTEFARQIILRMALPQGLLILAAALAVWYGVRRGLAPLVNLRAEIEQRSHRDLSALPAEQAPQEVQPVIRAMNDLLSRLSAAISAQQRFIADAAHQLRTPLAGIKTQTELALRNSQSDDVQATLRQLHTATEQTTRLVNQLLSLARAEPGARKEHATERLDIVKFLRDTTTEWVPRALERGIDLGFDGPEAAVHVEGNAFLLREMLNNLLDNAIRYTRHGGQVTTRVTPDTRRVVLSVEDTGPGIPERERERVFERFYRVLGTGAEGCGLGLAIVREIAQSHGAEIALDANAAGSGTVVRVSIPRSA
ncbi:MAG: sensor histidine kinase N-terminal domain-containing protein [Betaproteobacteria bacterium]|nr:sensor histidine kinase N-terminal domain-containing protein [Betaproteobacteria bacterium]